MARKPATAKSVEMLKHDADKRKNIPTAEYQSVLEKEQQAPKKVRYPRNNDLDPQLVWRGKDEQDWSDFVVHAPPLYIQEKVQPKVLVDELLRATKEHEHDSGELTPDLFADFNGIPKGIDKTEFYQHDQNWSNRIILGDSLQVMASLADREGLRGKVQRIASRRSSGAHSPQRPRPVDDLYRHAGERSANKAEAATARRTASCRKDRCSLTQRHWPEAVQSPRWPSGDCQPRYYSRADA